MSGEIEAVTDDAFKDVVLRSEIPVLVDFWATWCGPCKQLMPVLEEVAKKYSDRVRFVKMNVEENRATPAKYGVRGIPTLLLIKEGNVIATKVGGGTSQAQLETFLDSNIKAGAADEN